MYSFPGPGKRIPPPHMQRSIPQILQDKNKNIWLFNITEDPTEEHDLSELYPHTVRELLDRLKFYESTSVECVYPPDDPEAHPRLHGGVWGPWIK